MSRPLLLTIFLLFLHSCAFSQPSAATHLKHFSIRDKQLGTVNFYVSERDIDKLKPVLLVLDGSGDKPLFRYEIDATNHASMMMYSTIIFNYDSLASKYHMVFISKPAMPLADTFYVKSLDSVIQTETPALYTKLLDADWRAKAASLVIDDLSRHIRINAKKVVVMGYSEGAQVAPHVAVLNKKVTQVVCVSGNGLNQLYDFVIAERLRAVKGEISEQEAQNNIDTLMMVFKDIYAHPQATDKFWSGHTYKRWASFCTKDPIDYMMQLNIPIFIAHGTSDQNTQILTSDYIPLEFLKRAKKNLTYRTYPGYSHFFQEQHKDRAPDEHSGEVMKELFTWLDKQ